VRDACRNGRDNTAAAPPADMILMSRSISGAAYCYLNSGDTIRNSRPILDRPVLELPTDAAAGELHQRDCREQRQHGGLSSAPAPRRRVIPGTQYAIGSSGDTIRNWQVVGPLHQMTWHRNSRQAGLVRPSASHEWDLNCVLCPWNPSLEPCVPGTLSALRSPDALPSTGPDAACLWPENER
jgi:hypothetical protein